MAQGMDPAAMRQMCMDMAQSGPAKGQHQPDAKPARGMAGGPDLAAMRQQCMQRTHQQDGAQAKPPAAK